MLVAFSLLHFHCCIFMIEGVIKASTGIYWWKFLVIKEVYVDIAHTTMIKYRKEW